MAKPAPRKAAAKKQPSRFEFQFLGFRDGWYALRVNLSRKVGDAPLNALTFENEVVEWLIANRVTPGKFSAVGNGNIVGRPILPVPPDGSHLGVLLKRPADVMRFEMRFPCRGITPQSMMDALRGEATMVRFGPSHIAQVAYDANRRLDLIHGNDCLVWDDCDVTDTMAFTEAVLIQIAQPERSARKIHEDWMADRLEKGWKLGPKNNRNKTHPSLVPFDYLSRVEQAKDQLFADVVKSLLPLMEE
jgi:hypothetical protein